MRFLSSIFRSCRHISVVPAAEAGIPGIVTHRHELVRHFRTFTRVVFAADNNRISTIIENPFDRLRSGGSTRSVLGPVANPLRTTIVGVACILERGCGTRTDLAAVAASAAAAATSTTAAAAPFSTSQSVCVSSIVLGGAEIGIGSFGAATPLWLPGKVRGIDGEVVALDGRRSRTADDPLEEVFPLRDDFVLFVETETSSKVAEAKSEQQNVYQNARLRPM